MTPLGFRVTSALAPNPRWVFTLKVDGIEHEYMTEVRNGPFLHWRACRRMERIARYAAAEAGRPIPEPDRDDTHTVAHG